MFDKVKVVHWYCEALCRSPSAPELPPGIYWLIDVWPAAAKNGAPVWGGAPALLFRDSGGGPGAAVMDAVLNHGEQGSGSLHGGGLGSRVGENGAPPCRIEYEMK